MPNNHDSYYMHLANEVASRSKCLSRKVGAVLIRDDSILATGFNGPPRKALHCNYKCPRQVAGFASGEGLHLCPATHAEANVIAQAAANGVSTKGATLYLTGGIMPCKSCVSLLVNACIFDVVCDSLVAYDELSIRLMLETGLTVRKPKE